MRKIINTISCFFLAFALILLPFAPAEGMQSSNYIIEKDSINFAGTEESESANYRMSDTAGEIGTGEGQCSGGSCNYLLGGYRQGEAVGSSYTISITSPSDVALSPDISGMVGGSGTGNAIWNVTTDNPAGYQLSVRANTTPALKSGGYSFADYVPSGSDPDFNWSVGSTASEFGYSVEGTHTVSKFLDNGSACNIGSANVADKCWSGLSVSETAVATSASPNSPGGTATTLKFKTEAGSDRMQEDGDYTATVTVTAVQL